jgi:hypothetical protein
MTSKRTTPLLYVYLLETASLAETEATSVVSLAYETPGDANATACSSVLIAKAGNPNEA